MTVAVVKSAHAGPSIADLWAGSTGCPREIILAPPASLEEVGRSSRLILLALPAGEFPEALSSLRGGVSPATAVVSTCPEISLGSMRSLLGAGPALFRAMIPSGTAPGEGVVALAPEPGTADDAIEAVSGSLTWIGPVEIVAEEALDAVAALVLGGPAFMCAALEGMEEGAVREGLPTETARAFTHQTALATALLLREHAGSPADLKDQVASPGGTTIAALAILEDAGVRGGFIRAVQRTAIELRRRRDAAMPGVIE
jgi:pyrroline-5-carboxylate reductase